MITEEMRRKYLNNPFFHRLADALVNVMLHSKLSIWDIKEAFTVAETIYEQKKLEEEVEDGRG
jgi:hypothetical protein